MVKKFDDFFNKDNVNESLITDIFKSDNEKDLSMYTNPDIKFIYDDKYLNKMTSVIEKSLIKNGIEDFIIHPEILYMDGIPGVLFYKEDKSLNLMCYKNKYTRGISILKNFEINSEFNAVKTYTSKTVGFSEMINNVVSDILNENGDVNESLKIIEEARTWQSESNKYNLILVGRFFSLPETLRKYMYTTFDNSPSASAAHTRIVWPNFNNQKEPELTICQKLSKNPSSVKETTTRLMFKAIEDAVRGVYKNPNDANDEPAMLELHNDYVDLTGNGTKVNVPVHSDIYPLLGKIDSQSSNTNSGSSNIDVSGQSNGNLTNTGSKTADVLKQFEKQRLNEIQESLKEYKKTMAKYKEILRGMVKYIREYGKTSYKGISRTEDDDYDIAGMLRGCRCIIVTGVRGVGKSKAINDIIKEEGLIDGVEIENVTSGSSEALALYSYLYKFNGKIVVFDDTPLLFSSASKMAVWKSAFQNGVGLGQIPSKIKLSRDIKGSDDVTSNFYNTVGKHGTKLTPQERYYKEIGARSEAEKDDFISKRVKMYRRDTTIDPSKITLMAETDWEEYCEDNPPEPKLPTDYIYDGFVVVISNDTREALQQEGKGHWAAIVDRVVNIDLHPLPEAIWESIKETILHEYNLSDDKISDRARIIPKAYTMEVIDYVEELLEKPRYKNVSWRLFTEKIHCALNGRLSRAEWKSDVKDGLDLTLA